MAGKIIHEILTFLIILLFGGTQLARASPLYFSAAPSDTGKFGVQKPIVLAEIEKPMDVVLEAIMDFGGNIMVLIPPKDLEKRDPAGPDLGTARSYSGQRTAKVMWGQLASNSPTGPGKRRRKSIEEEKGDLYSIGGAFQTVGGKPEGHLLQ